MASLTYDSAAVLKNFAERKGVHYPMLSDPESKIIHAFGIVNQNIPKDTFAYGVPFPGTYIVDERGIVQAKYFEDDYTERYTAASMLVRRFGEAGRVYTTSETPHLRVTSSASDAATYSGSRITLVLEIEMKPGMHVYAPGVAGGYIPIDWKMPESKSWLPHAAAYPPSRMLRLAVIDETVPVYQGKLRLTRDLTLGNERELKPALGAGRELAVEGSFRYQACDDQKCYPPRDVPLKWTFEIMPHDSQRAPAELRRK